MSWLTLVTALVGLAVSLYRQFFSDSAVLKKLEMKYAALQARQQVEAERLKATYDRIKNEPPATGQALVDRLNETARKLRHKL